MEIIFKFIGLRDRLFEIKIRPDGTPIALSIKVK